jgi:hypothetical protein
MYIFKNFPGEKPPDPRPKGRLRLTRRGARLTRGGIGDGGEGGEGKGRGKGWEPQNFYVAYAHALKYSLRCRH